MKMLDMPFVQGFIRMCNDGFNQNWHERNGGNLSYRVKPEEVEAVRECLDSSRPWQPIGTSVPGLAGEYFLVTGSGKYMRLSLIHILLIKQFGKVVRVEENPGPSLCIPFLQTVQRVPKYKMISDLYPSDVTTKDKKVMTVDSFVIWDINDPVKYLSSLNASKEKAEIRLGNVVYNSIKTVLSSTNQADIILSLIHIFARPPVQHNGHHRYQTVPLSKPGQ